MSEIRLVRRRVEEPQESAEGRTGCVLAGAVLGVAAGALFAFFGLPPLLHHFFGETKVPVGATYEGDAKAIRVESVEVVEGAASHLDQPPPRLAVVTLTVRTNKIWNPKPSDFRLEADGRRRVDSLGAMPAYPLSHLRFELGVERALSLIFPLSGRGAETPKYLHLSDPPVRFELPEPDGK